MRKFTLAAGIAIVVALFTATITIAQDAKSAGNALPFGKIEAEVGAAIGVANDDKDGVERDFIPVSVPNLGDTLMIDLAQLTITVFTVYDSTEPMFIVAAPATVAIETRSSVWQESWTDMSGGFDPEYIAMTPMNSTEPEAEVIIDVTEIVRRWTSGDMPNYGLVLKSLSEDKSIFQLIRDGRYSGNDAKVEIWYSRKP